MPSSNGLLKRWWAVHGWGLKRGVTAALLFLGLSSLMFYLLLVLWDGCDYEGYCSHPPESFALVRYMDFPVPQRYSTVAFTEARKIYRMFLPGLIGTPATLTQVFVDNTNNVQTSPVALGAELVDAWIDTYVANNLTNQDAVMAYYESDAKLHIWTYLGGEQSFVTSSGYLAVAYDAIVFTSAVYYGVIYNTPSTIIVEPVAFLPQAPIGNTPPSGNGITLLELQMFGTDGLVICNVAVGTSYQIIQISTGAVISTVIFECCAVHIASAGSQFVSVLFTNGLSRLYNQIGQSAVIPLSPITNPSVYVLPSLPGISLMVADGKQQWRYDTYFGFWEQIGETRSNSFPVAVSSVLPTGMVVVGSSGQLIITVQQRTYSYLRPMLFPS